MEIFSRLYRYRRPDVEEFYGDAPEWHVGMAHGWIVHLETSAPSLLARGWTFEMGNAFGSEVEVSVPEVTRDPTTMRELILRDLHRERLPADRLRAEHIAPALTRLEERRRSLVRVDSIDQHGNPAADPDISIVVPLYGRIDFVEQQLAQFVHDPEFQNADLLYILDSPDLADAFRVTTAQLAQLYNVPFRAVVMSHNVGFSGVNNVGGDLARGRLLLLLNSDVFPREPGWLSALTAFYDQTSGIGALGPKLLYEDDSIQHAGLYFRRLMDIGIWNNEHYYKGLHRNLPAANVARAVPAVTAACMVIDLELYREMGGLRGMYIQGDYEDSDLCLRLSATGYQNWYLPDVELYHLEGQSYRSETRQLSSAYNRWLHSHIWNDQIASIMRVMR
jgi:GT2 family glycosyltransferase